MTEKAHFDGILDDKFTGVRYVKMEEFSALEKWNETCLHLDRRVAYHEKTKEIMMQPNGQFYILNEHVNKATGEKLCLKRMDFYTVQQYNYEKHGLFLNPASSRFMQKVRKERHFLDQNRQSK